MIRTVYRGMLAGLFVAMPVGAFAATAVTPPAMYPAVTWQGRTQAVIRILDRLDSHVETLTVPVGGTGAYRSLSVAVQSCVSRPATLPADSAVQVHLSDTVDKTSKPFDGWLLAAEPSLNTYGSPLYDVRVVSCGGDMVAPQAGPVPVPVTPQLAQTDAPEEEGGDQIGPAQPQPYSPQGGGPVPLAPQSSTPIPLAPMNGAPQSLVPAAPVAPSGAAPSAQQPLPPPEPDPGLE